MSSDPSPEPTLATWADPQAGPPVSGSSLPERYEDLGLIAAGGMGEVRRVRDRHLDRVLAMKILSWDDQSAEGHRRFLEEARLTARLQHPGIVPLHDQGVLADGRLWFTMREVQGRTLREAIAEAHAVGSDRAAERLSLRRLAEAFLVVCQTVAYAHSQGVIHRDLKPSNILLGAFGEVLVVDWGIARGGLDPGRVDRDGTLAGSVLGTPSYMSPEQARGDLEAVGPPSDAYALGAILYEILCGEPPYPGTARAAWEAVLRGPPRDVRERRGADRDPLPEVLVELCRAALARDPEARPGAAALADGVRAWLDGEHRRARAAALLAETPAIRAEARAAGEDAARLRAEARASLARLRSFDPVLMKLPAWRLEEAAAARERDRELAELRLEQALRAALEMEPELVEAHAALADLYRERLLAAEAARDASAARRNEVLLASHDRGRHAAWLQGDGALTLRTDPGDALVQVFRFVEEDRRLVPRFVSAHPSPVVELRLPRGSYVALVCAPGRVDVRVPFLLGRREHWDGVPPGGTSSQAVRLPGTEALGPDDVLVPQGWAWLGGDPQAADGLPGMRLWMDAFVVRRFAVTVREYACFLQDLLLAGDEGAFLANNPPVDPADASPEGPRLFAVEGDGRVSLSAGLPPWTPRGWTHPMVQLNAVCADAFAAWEARRSGRPWRLPYEWEREKAARGVDRRFLPWGDHMEPTWAAVLESFDGPPGSLPVTARPDDESVYTVRGLCGHARDFCANPYRREGPRVEGGRPVPEADPAAPFRALRGGSWRSAAYLCRPAGRFGLAPEAWTSAAGCRLVRTLDSSD